MQTENNQNIFNRNDALTFEEIQASTDLSGKIASASALKDVLPLYVLADGNYDFNNIPYERCYGQWFGTVQNAPSTKDGNYIKIGNIIIATDWNDAKFIKQKWGIYRGWISF